MSNDTHTAIEKSTTPQAPATTATTATAARVDEASRDSRAMVPRVDVLEDETGLTLLADMPGVKREKLELKVDGDALSIEGEIDAFESTGFPGPLEATYAEVRIPRFRRSFTLSHELDSSRIEANLKDGVLNLRIPKLAHAQPRRIEVQAA